MVFLEDEIYIIYQGRKTSGGDKRVVFIDKLKISEDGTLRVEGPTTDTMPKPGSNRTSF